MAKFGWLFELQDRSFSELYDRGFHWRRTHLEPDLQLCFEACQQGRIRGGRVRSVTAQLCYVMGDIHESNEAPKAAIKWYSRAIALEPTDSAAWREIGTCQTDMGEYRKARASFVKALALDPCDEWASRELAELTTAPPGPRYRKSDVCWAAAEALAVAQPRRALRTLSGARSTRATLWRACAHAARSDTAGLLDQLQRLARSKVQGIFLLPQLWHFLPLPTWRDVAFWRCLSAIALDPNSVPADHDHLPVRASYELPAAERVALQIRSLGSTHQPGMQASDEPGA
ncbi:MAG: tetratricopeptide repeat protein [Planctomycetota bacterium]|nr:tetratricopeptide repeat protein [Planctomycetota bacterium]